MNSEEMTNSLLKAVDILVDQRLKESSGDITKICRIISDVDANKGEYIVTDGTLKFTVYSEDNSYRVNEWVRVSVLNGDYSEKKFIIGRYSFLQSSGDPQTFSNTSNETKWSIEKEVLLSKEIFSFKGNDVPLIGYKPGGRLSLRMICSSKIMSSNTSYCISLHLTDINGVTEDFNYLSSDMIGDVNNFILPTTQEFQIVPVFITDIKTVSCDVKAENFSDKDILKITDIELCSYKEPPQTSLQINKTPQGRLSSLQLTYDNRSILDFQFDQDPPKMFINSYKTTQDGEKPKLEIDLYNGIIHNN